MQGGGGCQRRGARQLWGWDAARNAVCAEALEGGKRACQPHLHRRPPAPRTARRRAKSLATLHPLGLTDDWSDKLRGQEFVSDKRGATFEHYAQVVLTSIEPRSRPAAAFDAYEYTVQSHSYDTGARAVARACVRASWAWGGWRRGRQPGGAGGAAAALPGWPNPPNTRTRNATRHGNRTHRTHTPSPMRSQRPRRRPRLCKVLLLDVAHPDCCHRAPKGLLPLPHRHLRGHRRRLHRGWHHRCVWERSSHACMWQGGGAGRGCVSGRGCCRAALREQFAAARLPPPHHHHHTKHPGDRPTSTPCAPSLLQTDAMVHQVNKITKKLELGKQG